MHNPRNESDSRNPRQPAVAQCVIEWDRDFRDIRFRRRNLSLHRCKVSCVSCSQSCEKCSSQLKDEGLGCVNSPPPRSHRELGRGISKLIFAFQGFNRIVAIALLFMHEEDAFWLLVYIVEHLMPPEYYSRDRQLIGCQVRCTIVMLHIGCSDTN